MTGERLKLARQRRGWNQQEAALRVRVSQPYLSMLERGDRRLTHRLARRFLRVYHLSPTLLPTPALSWTPAKEDPQTLAEQLAALEYPGFAYLRGRARKRNPAELLLTTLVQDELEPRLLEALPWLLLRYPDSDTNWLVSKAKQLDLQNRLGFVVSMARQLDQRLGSRDHQADRVLAEVETRLEQSKLAREDTLCEASATEAERRWLRDNRSNEAQRWNLLTAWGPDAFRYAH